MTQTSKTLGALVVLALLATGAGVFAWRTRTPATRHSPPRPLAISQPSDAGKQAVEFVSLTISTQGETTVLERTPGQPWRLTAPVRDRADRVIVDAIVSQLQSARFKSVIDERPDAAALASYGLDAPSFTISARSLDGTTLLLEGGKENTFDGSIIVRKNHDPTVYAAEGGLRYAVARTSSELRDRQVLWVDEPQLTAIAIKSSSNDWAIERAKEQPWAFTHPGSELVDVGQLNALLASVAQEKALSFQTDAPSHRFAHPTLEVRLGFDKGRSSLLRFVRRDDAVEVMREESDGTVVLATLRADAMQFDRNAADLRERSVVRFKTAEITRIEIAAPTGSIVLERPPGTNAEGWQMVAPKTGKAKAFKVGGLLWSLSTFRALKWGEERPSDWAKYGLDLKGKPPPTSIALFVGAREVGRLIIGKEVPGAAATVYVRGTRDQVAESNAGRLGELTLSVDDLFEGGDAGVTPSSEP